MAVNPEFLPGLEHDLLFHNRQQTVFMLDLNGQTSNIFDNRISQITLQIIRGRGEVRTPQLAVSVNEGNVVEIKPHTPYQYTGDMLFLETYRPGLIPSTESINGEELSKEGKQIVKVYNNASKQPMLRALNQYIIGKHLSEIEMQLWMMKSHQSGMSITRPGNTLPEPTA
jgi:hypothetical protein